jgi:hypothetical protein
MPSAGIDARPASAHTTHKRRSTIKKNSVLKTFFRSAIHGTDSTLNGRKANSATTNRLGPTRLVNHTNGRKSNPVLRAWTTGYPNDGPPGSILDQMRRRTRPVGFVTPKRKDRHFKDTVGPRATGVRHDDERSTSVSPRNSTNLICSRSPHVAERVDLPRHSLGLGFPVPR